MTQSTVDLLRALARILRAAADEAERASAEPKPRQTGRLTVRDGSPEPTELDKRAAVEVVTGRQLPWFASERAEKRGLK